MKKRLLFVVVAIIFPGTAFSQDAQIPARGTSSNGQASASIGYFSNLVWRGQALTTGPSIQPMADLARGRFGFNIWSNFDVDQNIIVETDLTLNFAGAKDKLGYDVGVIYYGTRTPTTEFYLTLDYDVILAPYATFYYDVQAGKGGFLILGIGHSFTFPKDISIDLGAYASANFNDAVMGVNQEGKTFTDFYNMDFNSMLNIPFAGDWSFHIQLAYSFALTDASRSGISSASATGEHNVFLAGAGFALQF